MLTNLRMVFNRFSLPFFRFDENVRHFKLFYDGQHYVGEKRFNSLTDLVQDGLITFYIEAKAGCYLDDMASETAYANSPFGKLTTPQEGQFKELLMKTVRKTKNMMALLGAVSCKVRTQSLYLHSFGWDMILGVKPNAL